MDNQIEHISFERVRHVKILVNEITYRTFHTHNAFEFIGIIDGNATTNARGDKIRLKQGDIAIINPHCVHDILSTDKKSVRCLIVQVSRNFLQEYVPELKTTVFSKVCVTREKDTDLNEKIWRLLCKISTAYFSSADVKPLPVIYDILGIFNLLFSETDYVSYTEQEYVEHTKIIARITRIAEYIDNNYQYHIGLDDIAKEEDLSPNYVSQFFSRYIGVPFQKYLNNVRLEAALRLLQDTSLSVSEVANYSGFADAKYMSQIFRRYFNCTPRDYRKSEEIVKANVTSAVAKRERNTEYIFDRRSSFNIVNEIMNKIKTKN